MIHHYNLTTSRQLTGIHKNQKWCRKVSVKEVFKYLWSGFDFSRALDAVCEGPINGDVLYKRDSN